MLGSAIKTIGSIVGAFAPTVQKVIEKTPYGKIALDTVKEVLDLPRDMSDKDVAAQMRNLTPEQMAKLEEADYRLQEKLSEHNIKLEKLFAADRKSARVDLKDARKTQSTLAFVLVSVVVVFVAATFVAVYQDIDISTVAIINTIMGYLLSELKQVTTFYFGSSSGSQEKDQRQGP